MEINPFHYGHQYFLEQIPKNDEDILVVVVSTTLMQRGEFSVLNKRDKAQILLDHNVDIVVELPGVLSNQGGTHFAKYSLDILKNLGVTDLYFGSESNNLDKLYELSKIPNTKNFKLGIYNEQLQDLKSNDILGVSYIKNLDKIIPHLIKRINNEYNDLSIKKMTKIQSATSIRNSITREESIDAFLPNNVISVIKNVDNSFLYKLFLINLDVALQKKMNVFLSEELQLLHKFKKIILSSAPKDLEELCELASDKNNSKNKIRRIFINVALLIEAGEINEQIDYIHLLGFSKTGQNYLSILNSDLIITSLKNCTCLNAKQEIRISKLYNTLTGQCQKQDFLPPVIK